MPSRPQVFWFSRQKRVAAGAFLARRADHFPARRLGGCALARRDRNSAARRAQRRKRAGRVRGGVSGGSDAGGDRERREDVSRSRASAGIRGRNRRREVLQRFEGHQRGRRAQGHRGVSGAADRDSRRQGQGQPVHAAARAAARTRAACDSDRRGRRKNRGRSGRCGRDRRTRARSTAPCSWRANARGRATWCCLRRRARASTSSRITSSAGACSRNWSRSSKSDRDREARSRETKG